MQELGPTECPSPKAAHATDLVSPNPVKDAFPVLVEGAWVMRHGDFYYLFYSGDNCCGAKANYAVMVARSKSATGPFETLEQATGKPHSIILEKRGTWIAPGHNSVITNSAGNDWIVYHAVNSRRPREKASDEINTRRVMLIDRIRWVDGWPTIDGPSSNPEAGPRALGIASGHGSLHSLRMNKQSIHGIVDQLADIYDESVRISAARWPLTSATARRPIPRRAQPAPSPTPSCRVEYSGKFPRPNVAARLRPADPARHLCEQHRPAAAVPRLSRRAARASRPRL